MPAARASDKIPLEEGPQYCTRGRFGLTGAIWGVGKTEGMKVGSFYNVNIMPPSLKLLEVLVYCALSKPFALITPVNVSSAYFVFI